MSWPPFFRKGQHIFIDWHVFMRLYVLFQHIRLFPHKKTHLHILEGIYGCEIKLMSINEQCKQINDTVIMFI